MRSRGMLTATTIVEVVADPLAVIRDINFRFRHDSTPLVGFFLSTHCARYAPIIPMLYSIGQPKLYKFGKDFQNSFPTAQIGFFAEPAADPQSAFGDPR